MNEPSDTGGNGRAANGQFRQGNAFARGNPHLKQVHALRSAMLAAVTPAKLSGVVEKMTALALEGDVAAAKLVIEHCLGKPPASLALTGPDGEALGADLAQLESAILTALAPFGSDLRFRVALALKGIVDAGRAEQAGDPA